MPHVVLMGSDCAAFAGETRAFDVEGATVRRMIAELEARYPGLGDCIERRMSVAIDGEIHQDALGEALPEGAEVVLIPKIGGG